LSAASIRLTRNSRWVHVGRARLPIAPPQRLNGSGGVDDCQQLPGGRDARAELYRSHFVVSAGSYDNPVTDFGRRAWLFAGPDRGGERAAAMYTLIASAKLNHINPQAWLADLLADHPASRLHELLPWHWKRTGDQAAAA
jgi:hypothetical protein